jgi:hypothetical protein
VANSCSLRTKAAVSGIASSASAWPKEGRNALLMTEEKTPEDAIEVCREHNLVISEIKKSQWRTTNYITDLFAGII